MHSTGTLLVLVLVLATTCSISAFRATRSNLGTRILKKQAECQSLVKTPDKTSLDEGGDKFPSVPGDPYFNCRKVLDDLKRMYISENYPGLIAYPSKFPVKLPSGMTIMLPSPPEVTSTTAPPGSPKYIPVEGICMIHKKCTMFLENSLSEESYFKDKYRHCIALLNDLKSKYVKESNIDLGNPQGNVISIKCNGEEVSLLPESLSENSRVALSSYQDSTSSNSITINNVPYKPDYLKDPSSISTSDRIVMSQNAESSTSEKQPSIFSLKRSHDKPTSSVVHSEQLEGKFDGGEFKGPDLDTEKLSELSQKKDSDNNNVQSEDLSGGISLNSSETATSNAPPTVPEYNPVDDICMIHNKCKMILADINENEDASEQSYYKEKYSHCLVLLDESKSRYINDNKIETSQSVEKPSVECNGEKVSLLSESLSENVGSSSSGTEAAIHQKSMPAAIKTINDIHSKSTPGKSSSSKNNPFYNEDSSTSETNQPATFSFKRFNDILTSANPEQANRISTNPELNLTVRKNVNPIESLKTKESENVSVQSVAHANIDDAIVEDGEHAESPPTVDKDEPNESSNASDQDKNIDTSYVAETTSITQGNEDDVEEKNNTEEENTQSDMSNDQGDSTDGEPTGQTNNKEDTEVAIDDADQEKNAEEDREEDNTQSDMSNNQDDAVEGETSSQSQNNDMTELDNYDLDQENNEEEDSKQFDVSSVQSGSADEETTSQSDNRDVTEATKDDVDQESNAKGDDKRSIFNARDDSGDAKISRSVASDGVDTISTEANRKESTTDYKQTESNESGHGSVNQNNQKVNEVVYDMSLLGSQGSSVSATIDVISNNKGEKVEPNVEKEVVSEPVAENPPTPSMDTVLNRISQSPKTLGDEIMALEEDCRELLNMANQALENSTPDLVADIDSKHAECEDSLDSLKRQYISDRRLNVGKYRDVFPITLSSGAKRFVLLPRPSPTIPDMYLPVPLLRRGPGPRYEREDLFDDSVDWETVGSRRNKVVIDNPAFISNEKFLEYFNQGPSSEASTLTKFANMLHMNLGRSEEIPLPN